MQPSCIEIKYSEHGGKYEIGIEGSEGDTMMLEKIRHIGAELKGHAPFTALGALAGIFFMLIFKDMSKPHASTLFSIFHPGHVVLSAMVTAYL